MARAGRQTGRWWWVRVEREIQVVLDELEPRIEMPDIPFALRGGSVSGKSP